MFGIKNLYLYKWKELYFQEFEIEIAIEAIRNSIDYQDNYWSEIKEKFDETIKNDVTFNSLEDGYQSSYYGQFYSRENDVLDEIKKQQLSSSCLLIYSFFESRLNTICQLIEDDNSFEEKLSKIKKKGNDGYIKKYCKYLISVYGIKAYEVQPYIDSIDKYKTVRNCIAHNDGILKPNQKDELGLIDGVSIREFEDSFFLEIVDKVFLINIIDSMSSFYKNILKSIDKRYMEIRGT